MKEDNFYAYISRMKYINRWGLMRNTVPENIKEHSYDVAVIAHALALIANKRFGGNYSPEKAALYAMFHDTNEIITGDLPTPVKYFNPEIKKSYGELEDLSKEKLVSMLPDELKEDYRGLFFYEAEDPDYYPVVKAADKISAYIKCVEELKAGNNEFRLARDATAKSIKEMGVPAADWFMERFVPPFELTLDELE